MRESRIQEIEYRIRSLSRELGTRWVVAVSGGSDSVGLLRILHSIAPHAGLDLSVAHLHHGTRGEASDADADLVSGLAEALGLPFDIGHWRPTRTGHFEADARRARYAWLTDIARARKALVVAVGHTSDDQAETILHRILRGTGPRGLSGIPERRSLVSNPEVTLIRPLLMSSRQEIRDELSRLGQAFRDDSTNDDLTRTRSRIRNDLIPKLRSEYNPRITEALNRLGQLVAASNETLADRIAELEASAIVEVTPTRVVMDRSTVGSISQNLGIEMIRRAWSRAGWPEREMSTARWLRLHDFMIHRARRSRYSIGSGVEAVLLDNHLLLSRLKGESPDM